MAANGRAILTRVCPADNSVMVVKSLAEDCPCCDGCKVVRAAVKRGEARRAKALRLRATQEKAGR
jgi:hypothetical protein